MKIINYIIVCLFIMHCNSQSPEALWGKAKLMQSKDNLKESIINLELIIKDYPDHDLASKSQFQIADIYLNEIKEFDLAIDKFKIVIDKYPAHDVAKNSLFMIAYIYNNYLNSYTDAINNYKLFMDRYPNDELIPSVEYELKGLFEIEGVIDSLNSVVSKKGNT